MPSVDKLLHLGFALLIVGVFVVAPGLVLILDGDHVVPRPDCPYCIFLVSVAVALASIALPLLLALPLFAEFVADPIAMSWQSIAMGEPSIRAPPPAIL